MQEMRFENLEVGEEFGSITYRLTEEKLQRYRDAVEDPDTTLATLASKDYSHLPRQKYARRTWVNAGYEAWFESPPEVGELLTTTGRLADKYERRGHEYIRVETVTVGEDGIPRVRALTTLMLGGF